MTQRTPSNLRMLRGDQDHGRGPAVPDDFEPSKDGVERPKWLRGKAAWYWNQYAPELIGAGVLRGVDVPAFAILCALHAEVERAKGKVQASTIAQLRMLSAEFGLTPASRAKVRIGAPPVGKPAEPTKRDRYFGDGAKSA